tara:strand:- start:84 stop:620 length:537 start_codon:yes stop_codon:yes gene_type:complete
MPKRNSGTQSFRENISLSDEIGRLLAISNIEINDANIQTVKVAIKKHVEMLRANYGYKHKDPEPGSREAIGVYTAWASVVIPFLYSKPGNYLERATKNLLGKNIGKWAPTPADFKAEINALRQTPLSHYDYAQPKELPAPRNIGVADDYHSKIKKMLSGGAVDQKEVYDPIIRDWVKV